MNAFICYLMATSWCGGIGMVPLAGGFRLQALSLEMQADPDAAIALDIADIAAELGDLQQVVLVRLIKAGMSSL